MSADNLARHTAIQTIRKSRAVQGQVYKARAFRNRQKHNRTPTARTGAAVTAVALMSVVLLAAGIAVGLARRRLA